MSRGPRLTPEQAAAVGRPAGDAVVLAGAGSGKTTVLTERFVALVAARGLDPRRVAALTFTEKAAGEMRRRIADAFRRDPRLAARAADVEFAPIATIHGFCAGLLREHAVAAGVDPAFTMLDEVAADELLEDAWAEVATRGARDPSDPLGPLRRGLDADPGPAVRALFARLRGLGHAPGDAVLAPAPLAPAAAASAYAAALARLDEAVAAAALPAAAVTALARARAAFPDPAAIAAGDPRVLGRLHTLATGNKGAALPLPPRVAKDERDDVLASARAAAGAVADVAAAARLAAPLRRVLAELEATYARRKRALGALDFGDLELLADRLLARLADARTPLPGRPDVVLVDEYQDVNPVQARLLDRLRRSGGGRAADLFAVGDPKQSIYRFRRADVAVMAGAWAAVGPQGQARLTTSFRTRAPLVAFHNAFFARLLAGEAGGGIGYEPLVAGATFRPDVPPTPPELVLVDVLGSDVAPALAEGRAIAARIQDLVRAGAPRAKAVARADGTLPPPRPLGYGDIAVLLRARTHLKALERALLEAGVPFHVGKGVGFYQATEIEDLLLLLRAVHDPEDRFALAAFLTSPAVGARDDELVAVLAPDVAAPLDAARRVARLRPAVDALARLRRLAAVGALEELAREAIAGFHLGTVARLQPGGARRARNLEKAVAIARHLDDEGRHGLFDLLRRLTDLRDREVRESEAAAGVAGDAVAVETIHGAKGLEWPVVFVAGAGTRRRASSRSVAALDAEGRVGLAYRDPLEGTSVPSGALEAVRAADDAAEDAEGARLVYVAWTRAEERLVVSATARGVTQRGQPAHLSGAAKALWEALGVPWRAGRQPASLDGVPVTVTVEAPRPPPAADVAPWFARHGAAATLDGPVPDAPGPAALAAAATRWAAVAAPVPSLGDTPFVVSISDLLGFAASPAAWYRERVVGTDDAAPDGRRATEPDDPASGAEASPGAPPPDLDRLDEGREVVAGVDRAALGRAVHLALERVGPDADVAAAVRAALDDELPGAPPAVAALAATMGARALAARPGRALLAALAAGRGARREAAFHARVRFPDGVRVGGFEALLVKGTFDLWLDDPEGRPVLVDYKTNRPGPSLPDVAAVTARYALQLRLYALAAERIAERPVAGASLLLLDPAWGGDAAVEAPVDVGDEALGATRRLAVAFARARLEGRYPPTWEALAGPA